MIPDADSFYRQGVACFDSGQYDLAADSFAQAVSLDPGNTEYLAGLGASYHKASQYEKAIGILEKTVSLEPGNADYAFRLGICRLEAGNPEKAAEALEKAAELEGGNAEYLAGLGNAYYASGRYEQSAEAIEKAVSLAPGNDVYLNSLSTSYHALKQFDKAIEYAEKAVAIMPSEAEYQNSLGASLHATGQYQKAIESVSKALVLDPNNPRYLYNLGVSHDAAGQCEKAIEYICRAVASDPANAVYHNALGAIYYSQSMLKEALESYKTVAGIDPDNEFALFNAGLLCQIIGDYRQAADFLEKTCAINADDAKNLYYLGISYHLNRQYNKAIGCFDRSLSLNPDNATCAYAAGISYGRKGKPAQMQERFDRARKILNAGKDSFEDIIAETLPSLFRDGYEDEIINLVRAYPEQFIDTEYDSLLRICKDFTDETTCAALSKLQIKIWQLLRSLALDKFKLQRLCHYSKLSGIPKLVKKDNPSNPAEEPVRLRLSNASYMNDPSEGTVLLDFFKRQFPDNELLKRACKSIEESASNDRLTASSDSVFLFSLSTAVDELNMWAQYGELGSGCCYIFNNSFFDFDRNPIYDLKLVSDKAKAASAGNKFIPNRVIYIDDRSGDFHKYKRSQSKTFRILQSIADIVKTIPGAEANDKKVVRAVSLLLDQIRYLFKSADFEYEQEARLIKIVPLNSASIKSDLSVEGVPKIFIEVINGKPLKFTEIILGPKVNHPGDYTPYLLYTGKVDKVTKSAVHFR